MPTFLCQQERERFRLDELGRSPGGRLVHLSASGAHLVSGETATEDARDLEDAEPVEDLTNFDLEDRRVASVELDAEG